MNTLFNMIYIAQMLKPFQKKQHLTFHLLLSWYIKVWTVTEHMATTSIVDPARLQNK